MPLKLKDLTAKERVVIVLLNSNRNIAAAPRRRMYNYKVRRHENTMQGQEITKQTHGAKRAINIAFLHRFCAPLHRISVLLPTQTRAQS